MKKWWELNITSEENDLFNILARNPDFTWRSVPSLVSELNWAEDRLLKIVDRHVKSKMILIKKNQKGDTCLAYWERVGTKEEIENLEIEERAKKLASNIKASPGGAGTGNHGGGASTGNRIANAAQGIAGALQGIAANIPVANPISNPPTP